MHLHGLHLLFLIDLVRNSRQNRMLLNQHNVDPSHRPNLDEVTYFAVDHDGNTIFSTTHTAFPTVNHYVERCYAAFLTVHNGSRYYLSIQQDDGETLHHRVAVLEAALYHAWLPDPGAHVATTALVDTTFTTVGVLYVTDMNGVMTHRYQIEGGFAAFLAGHDKLTVQHQGYVGLVGIDSFIRRIVTGQAPLSLGKRRRLESGRRLTCGDISLAEPVLTTFSVDDHELEVPRVDESGQQSGGLVLLRRDPDHDQGSVRYVPPPASLPLPPVSNTPGPLDATDQPLPHPDRTYLNACTPNLTARTFG
ncbi:TPA: hypothetical protein DEP96_01560 [Candidatus Uhrbacteria bacterium]|nr:hypothetical protein [Candidatus Uhrbacteria bacterium]